MVQYISREKNIIEKYYENCTQQKILLEIIIITILIIRNLKIQTNCESTLKK